MTKIVNLSEARSKLSRLIDEAAAGEEIVIARNGVPQAKLVPLPVELKPRKPVNAMKITW
ncbi:MAG: type II toxin-antitoxin system prevent-host-death family antitoxin, partial [Bauldia sp.]|nr:type II toxin-antitoxin system prevent-host-death family antitoxin [Bauldia sp.]